MAEQVTVKVLPGSFAHVEWIDLRNDGVLVEVAIVKNEGATGNKYFFELNKLDAIDRQRIFRILTNRNAGNFQLWDLMAQVTLGNGMNALEYFHQLVKILTPAGTIIDPKAGVVGAPLGVIDTNVPRPPGTGPDEATLAEAAPAEATAKTEGKAKE